MQEDSDWDIDTPFLIELDVADSDIDRLDHVNNSVYLKYLECAAWRHTEALGLDWDAYQALDAAFVVYRHELDYLQPVLLGDTLQIGTWITENDGRLAMWRAFQIRRKRDGRTVFRARTRYICIRLANGRPCRMPKPFADALTACDGTRP